MIILKSGFHFKIRLAGSHLHKAKQWVFSHWHFHSWLVNLTETLWIMDLTCSVMEFSWEHGDIMWNFVLRHLFELVLNSFSNFDSCWTCGGMIEAETLLWHTILKEILARLNLLKIQYKILVRCSSTDFW